MASTQEPNRSLQFRRIVGAFVTLALVVAAIALGVSYSHRDKAGQPKTANADAPAPSTSPMSDTSSVPVLDTLKTIIGTGSSTGTTAGTQTAPVTVTADTVGPSPSKATGSATTVTTGSGAAVDGAFSTMATLASSNLAKMRTCNPTNGADLERMVAGTSCTVIMLTKTSREPYQTNKTMVVTSPKIIIGHPIDLPRIQTGKTVERMFDVQAGGSLDMRFVSVVRAAGRSFNGGELRVIVGGIVLVRLGGYFRGTAVIFRDPEQTMQSIFSDITFPLQRRRVFGGHVLVLGGSFFCYGCQVIRMYPYGLPVVNVAQVGRDFLVIAGVCVTVGVYHMFYAPYLSSINVGNAVAVLGGTHIRIGGGVEGAAVLVGQFGAGQNVFVGGGVLVHVGHQQQSAFMCLVRCGFGMSSVGAGVFIHIAELENRVWGVGAVMGAGQVYANGAGVFDKTGGEVCNSQISVFQALVGGNAYCGTGDMNVVGEEFGRMAVTQDQHGLGMTWFNGAGDSSLIYVPSFVTAVARSQFILGAEVFHGAGFLTSVNNTRWSLQVVNAGMPGYEGWVGLGAALFIRTSTTVKRYINYRLRPYSWVVNGVGVGGALIFQNNLYVDKNGVTVIRKQPTKPPKNRLLEAVQSSVDAASSVTPSKGTGLLGAGKGILSGFEKPSFVMAKSEMETSKARAPNPAILAKKIQEALVPIKARRRLQGQTPTARNRILNLFAGLSPSKLMEVWAASVDETNKGVVPQSSEVEGLDANGRWPEYVWVGNNSQCVLCGVSPLPSSSHVSPNNILPVPLQEGESASSTCQATDECTTLNSFSDIMAAAQATTTDPLSLPPAAQKLLPQADIELVTHKYSKRVLQAMQHQHERHLQDSPSDELAKGFKMPDSHILSYEVSLYCQPGVDDCNLANAEMKSAMKSFVDKLASNKTAFKLTAASANVPSALLDAVNLADDSFIPAMEAPDLGDGCGKGIKFNVHLTFPDKPSVQDVQSVLDDATSNTAPLLDAVNAGQDQNFCSATMKKAGALFFPSVDTQQGKAFYQSMYTGNALDPVNLWPDVTVVSDHEVAPIQHAIGGQMYTILLEGFTTKADVQVQLLQGTQSSGTVVATVPGGMASGEVRKVVWKAPDVPAETRAYLRAAPVGLPAIYAQSEVFDLLPSSSLNE